jgi:hypothetical protein
LENETLPNPQSEQVAWPWPENVPVSQGRHADRPTVAAYVPGAHDLHFESEALPVASPMRPGGHPVHLSAASMPVAAL